MHRGKTKNRFFFFFFTSLLSIVGTGVLNKVLLHMFYSCVIFVKVNTAPPTKGSYLNHSYKYTTNCDVVIK